MALRQMIAYDGETKTEDWQTEFDDKFSYLPPKDDNPMIFVSSCDNILNIKDFEKGSVIMPSASSIKPLANADVRQELKDFVQKQMTLAKAEERKRIVEEIEKIECKHDTEDDSLEYIHEGYFEAVNDIQELINKLQ